MVLNICVEHMTLQAGRWEKIYRGPRWRTGVGCLRDLSQFQPTTAEMTSDWFDMVQKEAMRRPCRKAQLEEAC